MKPIYIESVGVFAPGLVGWAQACTLLADQAPYALTPPPPLKPVRLAPDVRRRTTDHIRLAIEVATEATQELGNDVRLVPTIFASAESDGAIAHDICLEVGKDAPQVSPTRFHNSVNNAPAGYWCMAVGSQAPSTSIAAYDGTFSAGLIEAWLQLFTETSRVLLVAHDTPFPEPLHSARPMLAPFGVALVLTRDRSPRALARLDMELAATQDETSLQNNILETLRQSNPAARALPLLAALTVPQPSEIYLPYVTGRGLTVRVEPRA